MLAASRPVVMKFDPPPAGSGKLVPLSSSKRSMVAARIARVRKPNAAAGKTSIPIPVKSPRSQKISATGTVDGVRNVASTANKAQTKQKEQGRLTPLSSFHKEHAPPPTAPMDLTPAFLDRKESFKRQRMWTGADSSSATVIGVSSAAVAGLPLKRPTQPVDDSSLEHELEAELKAFVRQGPPFAGARRQSSSWMI